jgi:hypothetical protein
MTTSCPHEPPIVGPAPTVPGPRVARPASQGRDARSPRTPQAPLAPCRRPPRWWIFRVRGKNGVRPARGSGGPRRRDPEGGGDRSRRGWEHHGERRRSRRRRCDRCRGVASERRPPRPFRRHFRRHDRRHTGRTPLAVAAASRPRTQHRGRSTEDTAPRAGDPGLVVESRRRAPRGSDLPHPPHQLTRPSGPASARPRRDRSQHRPRRLRTGADSVHDRRVAAW